MALAIRGTDFAPGTAEDDIRLARELGVMASFHVACAKHGPRAQTMVDLARQNLLGRDVNLVHGNFLSEEELRAAGGAGTSLSITPEIEMQMGLGLPPTGPAIKAGVPLNLGTDVVSGVSTDMFTQMRFLLQTERALQNDLYHRQETMPPRLDIGVREALEIATIGGARTLGLDDRIGSLVPGKAADIVLLRKSDLNLAAIRDPVAAIVLHANPGNVDTVLVAGNVVKKGGKLTYALLPQKLRDLQRSADRLHRLLGAKLS
jgi:cytosine/adenosine deaminase-related metal-dependent hydrolase